MSRLIRRFLEDESEDQGVEEEESEDQGGGEEMDEDEDEAEADEMEQQEYESAMMEQESMATSGADSGMAGFLWTLTALVFLVVASIGLYVAYRRWARYSEDEVSSASKRITDSFEMTGYTGEHLEGENQGKGNNPVIGSRIRNAVANAKAMRSSPNDAKKIGERPSGKGLYVPPPEEARKQSSPMPEPRRVDFGGALV